MKFVRSVLAITAKELRIELRTREVVVAMAFFAALVLLLFAFALVHEGRTAPDAAAGILWIVIALAGTLGLSRAFDREREGNPLAALLLAPIDRPAIYVGKLLAMLIFLALTELVTVPLVALLFDAPLLAHPIQLIALLALGSIGFAATGSLFAGALVRNRARHLLLGILLYPLVLPVLMAGVRGTQALLVLPEPDLLVLGTWTRILVLFDVAMVTLSLWVFEPLVVAE